MAAMIKIARDNSFRTVRLAFAVQIDDEQVGVLGRGEQLECEVPPGRHSIRAFFAEPGTGAVNRQKRSGELDVEVVENATTRVSVKLGSAAAASFGAAGGETDWLILWPETAGELSTASPRRSPGLARLLLFTAALVSLILSRTVERSGTVNTILQVLVGLAFVAFLILTYRRYGLP